MKQHSIKAICSKYSAFFAFVSCPSQYLNFIYSHHLIRTSQTQLKSYLQIRNLLFNDNFWNISYYNIYLQFMKLIQMEAKADQFFLRNQIPKAIQLYKKIVQNLLLNRYSQPQQMLDFGGLGNVDDQIVFVPQNQIGKWYIDKKQKNELKVCCFDSLLLCFSIKTYMFEGRVWYQKMFKQYKDAYPIIFGLGTIYYNSNLIEKSELMFQKAIEIDPKNDKAYQGLMNINFYKKQKEQIARINALTVLQYNKNSIQARMIIIFTQNSHQEKINKLKLLLEQYPQIKSKIYSFMGILEFRQNNLQKAKQYFTQSIVQQISISPLINLANIAYLQLQYQQVQNYCKLIFEIDNINFQAIHLISNALILQQKYEESVQWIYGATQIYYKNYLPHYNLALWYYQQNILDSAIQSLVQAQSKSSSDNKYIQLLRGKIYLSNNNNQKANSQLQLCYHKNPDFKQVIYTLAQFYFQLQQYQKSLHYFLQYISKNQENSQILFIIGVCYLNLDKQDIYLQYLLKSINNNKQFMSGYLALGHFFFEIQDYQQSYEYFWKILQINNESQEALEAVNMIKVITVKLQSIQIGQLVNQNEQKLNTQKMQQKENTENFTTNIFQEGKDDQLAHQ